MKASPVAQERQGPSAFGRHLRRLRGAADLTQEELAERAGVSARLVSDLERGVIQRPRRDTIQLLADGLGLAGPGREEFVALARGRAAVRPEAVPTAPPWPPLPAPPTPIVGRAAEVEEVTALVTRPGVRLVTLTGPGGVGKTRLALEVADRAAAAFPDGACFVDLAPVHDPTNVVPAIAQALDVRPDLGQRPREALVEALRGQRSLLLLDNFERLVAAATDIADLLAAAPRLTLLATSRLPLHIRAEWEYAVGPLPLPNLGDLPPLDRLSQVPAVELFVFRASAANRRFALTAGNAQAVAEIAVRLDGLPLAIELAAARVKVLSPADLLARLERRLPLLTEGARDLPVRQQAMRATIGWSHDLLDEGERRLFRWLAVFNGGCTIGAIEAVCDGGVPPAAPSVLDRLAALLDHGLLRPLDGDGETARFGMLETIREFGLECLAAAGEEAEARRRHLAWCAELAEAADPQLIGPDQQRWFARLAAEHDNIRAALGWAMAGADAAAAMRLGAALYRFWATNGLYEEGRRWYDQLLAMEADVPPGPRAHALLGAGVMDYFLGDYGRAAARWNESLVRFETLGDKRGIAYSHGNLGLVADAEADYPRARANYGRALALFRELDDRTYTGFMLHNLGLIAYFEGDYERATALYDEALALARELGDQHSVAMTLGNMGLVAFAKGAHERALKLQREALESGRHLNNRPWLVKSLEGFAQLAAGGAPARAARLFGAVDALRTQFGNAVQANDREINERHVAVARASLGEAAFTAAWAEGSTMSLDEAIEFALGG